MKEAKIKTLISLIPLFLLLTNCGGGGSVIEQKVIADLVRDGAWNSNRDYEERYSDLQYMVDTQSYVELECRTYEGSVITIKHAITIVGKGFCSVTPSFRTKDGRSYAITLEKFVIDGNIDGYNNIGLDFENCSECYADKLRIINIDYGVFISGNAYYSDFTNLSIRPNKTCYEMVGVANSNHINKGSCLGIQGVTYGVVLDSVNNISVSLTSFEKHKVGIDMSGNVNTAVIIGVRLEAMDIGIEATGSTNETIIGVHYSGVGEKVRY